MAFPRSTQGSITALAALGPCLLALAGCESSIQQATVKTTQLPPPLLVSRFDPEPGEVEVGPASSFHIIFSNEIDPDSLPEEPVSLTDAETGGSPLGQVTLEDGNRVLVFTPTSVLSSGAEYCLTLSSDLKSTEGGSIKIDADSSGCAATYMTFSSTPSMTGTIRAEARSSSSIEVNWEDVSVSEDGCFFNVFVVPVGEAIDPSFPAQTSPPGSISALLTGLAPDAEYQTAIQARDPAGNLSPLSAPVVARTLPETMDEEPPNFGGITSLAPLSPTTLRATWQPATDNLDPPEFLRYNAYVALTPGGQDFEIVAATSAPGATEMVIGGLSPDTTHFVVVRAVDTADNEDENTVEASATTPVSYSLNIRPILIDEGGCSRADCHVAPTPDGNLSLDTYQGLIQGGLHKNPNTVVPGDGKGSYILWRTDQANPNYERLLPRMPQAGRALRQESLRRLERWIDQGALDN